MSINFVQEQRIDGETAGDRFGAYSIQVDGEVIVGATGGELADINDDGFLDLIVAQDLPKMGGKMLVKSMSSSVTVTVILMVHRSWMRRTPTLLLRVLTPKTFSEPPWPLATLTVMDGPI